MEKISIQIPSMFENIRIVESFIDNAKEKFHIADDLYGNIMVAVTESVNNAIKHGNGNDRKKLVSISLIIGAKDLKFVIEDQGSGFDPNSLADPTLPENISKPYGRGVFLMRNLCDEIVFSDKGRVVEMKFNMN
ncbi:MAG TPA: ATP-binding protein [Cytophagales bacterium]|nr:ATP-binding protein [Cytophagales bacterium]